MAYKVGYKKPSDAAKWPKGFCPNPQGRGGGKKLDLLEIYQEVLNGDLEYSDGKKWRKSAGGISLNLPREKPEDELARANLRWVAIEMFFPGYSQLCQGK